MKSKIFIKLSAAIFAFTSLVCSSFSHENDLETFTPLIKKSISNIDLGYDLRGQAYNLMQTNHNQEAIHFLENTLKTKGVWITFDDIHLLIESYTRHMAPSKAQALSMEFSKIIASHLMTGLPLNIEELSMSDRPSLRLSFHKNAQFYDQILKSVNEDQRDYQMILRGAAYAYFYDKNYAKSAEIWHLLLQKTGFNNSVDNKGYLSDLRGAAHAMFKNKQYEASSLLFDHYFKHLKEIHHKINWSVQERGIKEDRRKQVKSHAAINSQNALSLYLKYFAIMEEEDISVNDLQEALCLCTDSQKLPRQLANIYWKKVNIDDLSSQTLRKLIKYLMKNDPQSFHLDSLHQRLFELTGSTCTQDDIVRAVLSYYKSRDFEKSIYFWKKLTSHLSNNESKISPARLMQAKRMAAKSYVKTFDFQASAELYDQIIEEKKALSAPISKNLCQEAIQVHKKLHHYKKVFSLHMIRTFSKSKGKINTY